MVTGDGVRNGEGGLQYGTQQSMELVADMQGAVDIDSGYGECVGMSYVYNNQPWGRIIINHGYRLSIYIDTQSQRSRDYLRGKVVEYRPDTTTHTNRTSFGFEEERGTCNRGERFQQSKYRQGWGSMIQYYLTILMLTCLDEGD
ncbi:hypothetical protein N9140_00985 [bacterium]|nr:hypothetical protein [bacterium]